VPPKKGPNPPGPETSNLVIAPLLDTGALWDRTRVVAEATELLAKSPRESALGSDGPHDCHHYHRIWPAPGAANSLAPRRSRLSFRPI